MSALSLIPNLSPTVLAAGARAAGIVAFMPGLSAPQVPSPVRMGLIFGICVAVAPAIARTSAVGADASLDASPWQYGLAIISELALGAVLGYGASLLMEAARVAGELIDMQTGLRAAELFDPIGGTRSSLLGTFYYLLAVTLFLQLDGHHWVIAGLQRSFQSVPVGQIRYHVDIMHLMLNLCGTMFDLALRMGAPVVGALLLTDIAFGLVVRAVPHINILFVGMPAKIGLGLIGLALSTPIFLGVLTGLISDMQAYILQVLRLIG